MSTQYVVWELDKENIKEEVVKSMDALAQKEKESIQNKDIIRSQYIINEAWAYYPWAEALLKKAELIMGRPFSGVIADLGSGSGVGAALIAKRPRVQEVYAIEYSLEHVRQIMPLTFKHLNAPEEKITRVVGSFNQMKVPEGFFDFIIEIGSLHHSENLDLTVREIKRVLKPGGYLVSIDRAYPNRVTDDYLNKTLDVQMTDEQKKIYNLPPNFTRRMWGEHEYRVKEWKEAFAKHNFFVYGFRFVGQLPLPLRFPAKIFYSIFGNFLMKRRVDFFPYYRWFFPYFKAHNFLLIAQKN